jgi:hypothetical protein
MGNHVTKAALQWQFNVNVKDDAQKLRDAKASGVDCATVVLTGLGGGFIKKGQSQSLLI